MAEPRVRRWLGYDENVTAVLLPASYLPRETT